MFLPTVKDQLKSYRWTSLAEREKKKISLVQKLAPTYRFQYQSLNTYTYEQREMNSINYMYVIKHIPLYIHVKATVSVLSWEYPTRPSQ